MSKFYTNVSIWGGEVFVRGYSNGSRFVERVKFSPYLYLPTKKGDMPDAHSIKGLPVSKKHFSTPSEARKWKQAYEDVEGFDYFGYDKWQYVYIHDNYLGEIEYDKELIRTLGLDIEVIKEDGTYADLDKADTPVTTIALEYKKPGGNKKIALGYEDWTDCPGDVHYIKCIDEADLLHKFLRFWDAIDPDIITGWNCIPTNQSVWGKNEITSILDCGDQLTNSVVKNRSPISKKLRKEVELANGWKISASGDHRIPVRAVEPEKYTNLRDSHKKNFDDVVLTVDEIQQSDKILFVEMPRHENINPDQGEYSDDALYLAGIIYTDGSLKDPNNSMHGYTVYQSDYGFLKSFDELGVSTKIVGPYKNSYSRYINPSLIGSAHDLIYTGGKKTLNLTKLSRLSARQFFIFMSGVLDGDGCYSNGLSFCNFNGDLDKFVELLNWNGCFVTSRSNLVRLIDYPWEKFAFRNTKRFGNFSKPKQVLRNSSQKASKIAYKKIDDKWFVRVNSVTDHEVCEMMDIETDTHYFISRGVRVHNCEKFDIPYLVKRLAQTLGEEYAKKLSPSGRLVEKTIVQWGKEIVIYHPVGLSILDYMELYKKFIPAQEESYALDHIAFVQLKERKVDYKTEYKTLAGLYKKNFNLFMHYNVKDVSLVFALENKMRLIELCLSMAYDAKTNYADALTTVLYWDVLIYNYLADKGIVVPKFTQKITRNFDGGYVKEPLLGMHDWVMSFDLTSLYPHLIMQYSIGPETFVKKLDGVTPEDLIEIGRYGGVEGIEKNDLENIKRLANSPAFQALKYAKENNLILGANGTLFRKDIKSFAAQLMELKFKQRKEAKGKMLDFERRKEAGEDVENEITRYDRIQHAKKRQLNAFYGALTNTGFRYYNVDIGEAVTLGGQLSIKWVSQRLNDLVNTLTGTTGVDYVVAIDTDSCYLNFGPYVKAKGLTEGILDHLDKLADETVQPVINKAYDDLAEQQNVFMNVMKMKREGIGDRAIWVAKKRYMMSVLDNEGVRYAEPKLKTMGLETVRSSTPAICREALKEAFKIIMTKDVQTLRSFVDNWREKYYNSSFVDIAFPRGINGIKKYADKGTIYKPKCPMHVRGALLYNKMIADRRLDGFNPIYDGDKIKFVMMKLPNPIHENVLAAHDILPDDLMAYIDYPLMFQKTFLDPVENVLQVIGWDLKEMASLGDLF